MSKKRGEGTLGRENMECRHLQTIKRAEEQALAFSLLNITVDIKTQGESNISGQNGKKALDKNVIGAIQTHLATYFECTENELQTNWRQEPMNIQQRIADKCRNLNKKKK